MTHTDDTAGCVITSGGAVPFDEWYWQRFGEAPSRENIRRRLRSYDACSGCGGRMEREENQELYCPVCD